ncbi:MAG: inositol monophosphatase [Sphaerochaetaceae bacterium]|nr:inositol monophosphatase [Sphaerochaetaceae bacterium]
MQETNLSKDDTRITRIDIQSEPYSDSYGFNVETDDQKAFFNLCSAVHQCGVAARKNQSQIHRSFKADGTILTETDLAVSDAILATLKKYYPDCNIITEEIDLHDFKDGARYTFVLDPIDGTDSYSQGIATWCVALGILDENRVPCGGIVFAPRFGVGTEELFFCSMPGDDRIFLNGELFTPPQHYDAPKQVTLGSNVLRYTDISAFGGKIRSFGSSITHIVAPLAFSNIDACFDPLCYAWDIAAAHALVLKAGMVVKYYDGSDVVYDDRLLLERKMIRLPLLVGNEGCVKYMKENFKVNMEKLK